MLVCQSVALLSPRWQAELGGRFAGRRVKAMPQRPANMAAAGHTTLRLAFPRCPGLLVLNRAMAGLLAEAPAPWPELLGSGDAGLLLLCLTPSRALPAGGEKRLVEGSPARRHRLDVVRLQSGLRRDRVARFGQAGRVIRAGRGAMESKRCALLATWPGLRPMVRRGCRGDEAPGRRILPHPHTMVRPQRIGASQRTRRRRRDGHGRWRGYLVVFNLTESCARFLAFRSSRMRCPNV